ncbi:MAG: Outer rane porin, OprD family [Campylobacterota bacterium]|nr:Outer rane porin, OprD family [Campylobacterota bacterium]
MMKKTAILTLSAVLASQLMGAEDLSEMIKEGKAGGYVRIHHIEPSLSDTVAATGSVIGGKLKYQTGALYGLRFGAALYTTHDTGLTKESYKTKDGYSQVAQGLHGDEMESYSTLGEAYASYHLSNTDITYGRQEFKTPMTELAVTIIPNLFEGTVATIKEMPDFTVTAAHIIKMQYGTRAATDAGLIGDGAYAITSGAGYGFVSPVVSGTTGVVTTGAGKESFQDMSIAMMGTAANMDTSGVTSLGIDYAKGALKIRAWDYYAHEMYNTVYGDLEYKMNAGPAKVTLGAQILKQDDVGDFATSSGATTEIDKLRTVSTLNGVSLYKTKISADGSIDALLWGVQAKADIGDFSFSAAYNANEDGHVINAWGGDPAYTSMIFARNEYRADTTAYKLGAEYNFASLGISGLKFIYNHAAYDTDVKTWTTDTLAPTGMRNEKTEVDDYVLHYAVPSVKGLWFRLFHVQRDNDTRQYEQEHTRLIANLSF